MCKKLLVVLGCIFSLLVVAKLVVAQDGFPLLWEDHFEDDDVKALRNVGWIYYPEQDVSGQIVEQRNGELFIEAGTYGGILGVGLVETNGIPRISLDANGNITDGTIDTSKMDMWSSPNQILTFKINFVRFSTSNFFVGTRMPIDTSRGDADPTEAPAYTLVLNPLQDYFVVAKYQGPMAALAPETWTYFTQPVPYSFELEVYYWVRWYLKDGDLKVKIWEGEESDAPEAWLVECTDPQPRIDGNFTMFAAMGAPPAAGQGDRFILDDIVMRSSIPGTGIADNSNAILNDFQLEQNYPNPFNPNTSISFMLTEKNMTRLVIYNTMGQVVRTLVNSEMDAGSHTIAWDGLDENDNPASSGIYLYRLTSGDHTITKRMALMK